MKLITDAGDSVYLDHFNSICMQVCVFWSGCSLSDFHLEHLFIHTDPFSTTVREKINSCTGTSFLLTVLSNTGLCIGNGPFIFEKDIKLTK